MMSAQSCATILDVGIVRSRAVCPFVPERDRNSAEGNCYTGRYRTTSVSSIVTPSIARVRRGFLLTACVLRAIRGTRG